ncbi:MAG: hypothetical protein HOL31_02065 [Candidatus Scalindua sp.]|nr:hypothetical protein [Candidatus Scalindua sp.]
MEYNDIEYHYKTCKLLKGDHRQRYAKKKSIPLDKKLKEYVEIFKNSLSHAKLELKEARDCEKNTCLDEVYECRWDMRIMPEGVRLRELNYN